jgi:hypothetical protein
MTDDKPILHFIYLSLINVFKKNKSKSIKRNELLEYVAPFLIYEGLNTKSLDPYFKFMCTIDYFVKEHYLIYENGKYSINYESNEYKLFMEMFNNYKKNIVQLSKTISDLNSSLNDSEDSPVDEQEDGPLSDAQDDPSSYAQDDPSSDAQDDTQDDPQDDPTTYDYEDSEYSEDGCGYYIFKSLTSQQSYLINKKLNKCSCPSYTFCTSYPKTCKHLKFIKNNDVDGLDVLDVFEKCCYCQYNNTDYICTHITDNFNEN